MSTPDLTAVSTSPQGGGAPRFSFSRGLLIGALLALAAGAAHWLTPTLHTVDAAPDLERTLPRTIGDWRIVETATIPVSLTTGTSMDQPYDQSVMRTYADGKGHYIQTAVAWGKTQRQEIKIHRPELCYPAQGLQVTSLTNTGFPLTSASGTPVTGKRMVTRDRSGQVQLVSYWIRIGRLYSDNAWQTRLHIFKEGLAGRIPDGVLVRVSQYVPAGVDQEAVFQRQEAFAAQLVSASDVRTRAVLAQ